MTLRHAAFLSGSKNALYTKEFPARGRIAAALRPDPSHRVRNWADALRVQSLARGWRPSSPGQIP